MLEAGLLVILSVAVGFGANQWRSSGSVQFRKNYFDLTIGEEQKKKLQTPANKTVDAKPAAPATAASHKPKHDFQSLTYAQVESIFGDPATGEGLNVFVDARRDELFNAGHIPNAVQCDPYNIDNYVDAVVERISGASKVIVYCGGGDCIDSILLSKELVLNYDVPIEKLYVYEGGWTEWTANGMSVETGGGLGLED
jgi:rhodanese-related sulfurtransferase